MNSTDPSAGLYRTAHEHAVYLPRIDRGRIVVSGRDRASYLHGLLTNDIATLQGGEGCYAAYLTPQGRMITDLWVYELGDVILLVVGADQKDVLLQKLDQFIFSEDVQLGDVTATFGGIAIIGPQAAETASALLDETPAAALEHLKEHGNIRTRFRGQPAIVLATTDLGLPAYEILCDRSQADALIETLQSSAVPPIDRATADAIRIEAGVPVFGRDMDEHTIPLEAGIESRAISLTKGCYVGQEVIIRILHRGHGRVARRLVRLQFDGERVPPAGQSIQVDGRDAGQVTSAVMSPSRGQPIGLGYVVRDLTTPGTRIVADGVTGVIVAAPSQLSD
jgi:folate-binding protein YgfZ